MEYVIAALSALACILLTVLLLKTGRRDNELSRDLLEKYFRLQRGELLEGMQAAGRMQNDASRGLLHQLEERLKTLEASNQRELEAMRESMSRRLREIQADNAAQLEKIRGTVDEKLQKTLEDQVARSFERVSRQLEEVYKGLGEMQSLAAGVGDLKRVLSNVKARGVMGEIQLGAILREILSPEQYEENVAVIPGSPNRVEYAARLPGDGERPVYLPIDAKFPADAYENLQAAYDSGSTEAVTAAVKVLSDRLRGFARDIRDKYIEEPHTTGFAILFLPFEGLYAEVVNRGLLEPLQRDYHVNIAGPSTMAALLNSLQMGFRTLAIQKRSGEVWKILGAVKAQFGQFESVLATAQKRVDMLGRDLDALVGRRTRQIRRALREVETLSPDESPFSVLGDTGTESE